MKTTRQAARVAALLRRASEILDGGKRWTKGASARGRQGNSVNFRSYRAVRFCLSGALSQAAHDLAGGGPGRDLAAWIETEEWSAALIRKRMKSRPGGAKLFNITTFNDGQDSYEPVGEVLAEAAEEAERLAAAP